TSVTFDFFSMFNSVSRHTFTPNSCPAKPEAVHFVLHGWLQQSAATSHAPACRLKAHQGFVAPGSRPPLTRETAH
ncbi:hypothetical protein, partial [Caballeronia arationis]|uniref:hypothetical protein n=1 Tax=Caballeronia arationis TaxID=1777142 RepID=UPI001F427059